MNGPIRFLWNAVILSVTLITFLTERTLWQHVNHMIMSWKSELCHASSFVLLNYFLVTVLTLEYKYLPSDCSRRPHYSYLHIYELLMNYLFRMEIYSYVFFILMCFLINNNLRGSRYKLCDKLVIAHLSRTMWPIFSQFFLFSFISLA